MQIQGHGDSLAEYADLGTWWDWQEVCYKLSNRFAKLANLFNSKTRDSPLQESSRRIPSLRTPSSKRSGWWYMWYCRGSSRCTSFGGRINSSQPTSLVRNYPASDVDDEVKWIQSVDISCCNGPHYQIQRLGLDLGHRSSSSFIMDEQDAACEKKCKLTLRSAIWPSDLLNLMNHDDV